MQAHFQLSDAELAHHFEHLTLTPTWFTHEAHLRLGWYYVTTFGLATAIEKLCQQIQTFDRTFDDGIKYHKTITVAFAHFIAMRQFEHQYTDFQTFIQHSQELITDYRKLIAAHYSYDLFSDIASKTTFVEPDLQPFFG